MYVSWLRVGDTWVFIEVDVSCPVVTSVFFCVVAIIATSSYAVAFVVVFSTVYTQIITRHALFEFETIPTMHGKHTGNWQGPWVAMVISGIAYICRICAGSP